MITHWPRGWPPRPATCCLRSGRNSPTLRRASGKRRGTSDPTTSSWMRSPDERPDDAVLSEEGADDPVRLRSQRVWIVDPLDGTREFSELGAR